MTGNPGNPACRRDPDRPCDALARDPEAVLGDPDAWPDHLCPDVARESTRRWAAARARIFSGADLPGPVREWAATWPLRVSPPLRGSPLPPGLLPLDGPPFAARAALILTPDIPFRRLAVFGIVDDLDGMACPAQMVFTVTGHRDGFDDLDDRVSRFQGAADRWWMVGRATGRPPGHSIDREHLHGAYAALRDSGIHPTQEAVAERAGVSVRSLRNLPGGWPTFTRDAEAARRHRDHLASVSPLVIARRTGKKRH